ncbi:putative ABC transporter [Emiliania huxleyi CCMP1516]|uniref:ABC transporter domain-containing protein n=2 Tax=Emiliania huxleyi TaxID=2903 RepID=A0A0D3I6V8_EMIH1|nr:putative ABC transporter [Emiliania huxleyi CCMP1516]EOD06993.1 putative ABC transporter [Emiliania huxleyi CCMP1516]|eukprot:XP_005759422.1 putative ABC transporter [Emiliania huxleyi CCMP1516]
MRPCPLPPSPPRRAPLPFPARAAPTAMATYDIAPVLSADSPDGMKAAAKTLADKVAAGGPLSLKTSGLIASLKSELADKGKAKANQRAASLIALNALLTKLGASGEAWIAPMLPDVIEALSDKMKPVQLAANEVVTTLGDTLSPNALRFVIPMVLAECDGKWQGNLGRAQMLGNLSKKHPKQMARHLTEATVAPARLPPATAPSLSFLSPQPIQPPPPPPKTPQARIVENMAKLCDDPYEIAPFVPLLLPALERAKEEISDPECRDVCAKAHEQLSRTANKPPASKVSATIEGLFGAVDADALAFATSISLALCDLKNLAPADWAAALKPCFDAALPKADTGKLIGSLLEQCAKDVQIEEAKEEVDDAEQLCDCQFSLAYGNKVLLNQTKLKLKRGYRYGLCGQNDSGKTSLMRAIANQQVEGFPPPTELRTMFVETDVTGEVADTEYDDGSGRLLSECSVIEFVSKFAGLQKYGVTEEMAREKLLSVGFAETDAMLPDGTLPAASLQKQVGRLSGGWRMKCALTRAMLMKADILLLDEPTNHLDPGNVKWVIDYLTSLSNVTSIIVSHDIKVLDIVCTHTLQITNLKLKLFKGNLTEVAKRDAPELLSYFELKATKFKMNFPQPGPLEGVTSKGKHIMKMTNITFTYPAAERAQLTGVTVRVSLCQRRRQVDDDQAPHWRARAGRRVWRHPNCRVAYVAQHAFHHIEKHLEKTPNEYIRWRYEHGSDKESLQKITAKMTPEEEKKITQVPCLPRCPPRPPSSAARSLSHSGPVPPQVCPEVWHLENHTLNLKGSYDWLESANKEATKQAAQADTYIDGLGNEVAIAKAKKPPTKAELKKIKKAIAEKRKGGLEVYTDEELEEAGFLVEG